MQRTLVREDWKGLFIRAGGYVARPGNVRGYDHAFDMSYGGLSTGDYVKAAHIAGSQITKLRLPNGKVLHWHHEES